LPSWYRLCPGGAEDAAAGDELGRDAALATVEAVLFAAEEPLPPRRLAAAAGLKDAAEARRQAQRLRELLDRDGSAFRVEELAGGYQLLTRPEFHPWLSRLRRGAADLRLSAAARETLTIIAYRQPITRADLEGIRGVQSAEVLQQLMEKGLVRLTGRDDSLGRPMLYGTTKKFLQLYGLKNLRDLPRADELAGPTKQREDAPPDGG
jgi:segregation and condensation protein B